jgi:ArsR family metal-binding transcriptional regulator
VAQLSGLERNLKLNYRRRTYEANSLSSLWVKAWKTTPRIDCGLCGSANCGGFARSFVVGDLDIDACPLLRLSKYSELKNGLESLKKRSPTLVAKPAAKLPEGGVLFTRPCQDTDEKVMAELRVFNGVPEGTPLRFGVFDPQLLCDLMDCVSSGFELVRCSRDLGYGRAEINDMSITLMQDGRINMRRVSDKNEVLALFNRLEQSLLGSTICNCCGNDLLSVLSGYEDQHEDQHPVLSAGSSISLDLSVIENSPSIDDFEPAFGKKGLSISDSVKSATSFLLENLTPPEKRDIGTATPSFDLGTSFCDAVELAAGSKDNHTLTIALMVLSLVRDVENGIQGLLEFKSIVEESSDHEPDAVSDLIGSTRNGKLEWSGELPEHLVEVVAHLSRIDRAIRHVDIWDG